MLKRILAVLCAAPLLFCGLRVHAVEPTPDPAQVPAPIAVPVGGASDFIGYLPYYSLDMMPKDIPQDVVTAISPLLRQSWLWNGTSGAPTLNSSVSTNVLSSYSFDALFENIMVVNRSVNSFVPGVFGYYHFTDFSGSLYIYHGTVSGTLTSSRFTDSSYYSVTATDTRYKLFSFDGTEVGYTKTQSASSSNNFYDVISPQSDNFYLVYSFQQGYGSRDYLKFQVKPSINFDTITGIPGGHFRVSGELPFIPVWKGGSVTPALPTPSAPPVGPGGQTPETSPSGGGTGGGTGGGGDSGGGSGDSGSGGDSGGGSGIGDALGKLFGVIGDLLIGLLGGAVELVTSLIVSLGDMLQQLLEFFSGFTAFLAAAFPFLPEPVMIAISSGIILMIILAIIKFIRG